MFQNRKLLIATKHGKEQVIAPLVEQALGVSCFVTTKFDTDTLGTFSGEVPRKEDALSTLRNKCLLAMGKNGCELGIANEGSFGAHPSVFFAAADDELMIFIDLQNEIEIVVREISMNTNFKALSTNNEAELLAFANEVKFPSHGLIMKPEENDYSKIIKGITTWDDLKQHFQEFLAEFGCVYLETDMRANFNPTRMQVIEKATLKLVQAIHSKCPNCQMPGFVVTEALSGLPCSWCHEPTNSTLLYKYTCKKCDFTNEHYFPHQKTEEDPAYCDFCNP